MTHSSTPEPLVFVVTPVRNGAAYLRECLESVLAQDYENWVHVVVDNASIDRSAEIVGEFEAWDDRFLLRAHTEPVSMLDNFNRALAEVPDEADYVKQLHADDALRPGCLRSMVEAMQSHPQAVMVSAARYAGDELRPEGAPRDRTILRGREMARELLLRGVNYLGTPSIPLLRREHLGSSPALFTATGFPPRHPEAPPLCHADKESYLALLERGDVIFLPEPLLQVRRHRVSATAHASRVGAWRPSHIEFLMRHGARFLEPQELRDQLRSAARSYARALAWRMLMRRCAFHAEFQDYQRLCLEYLVPRLRDHGCGREAAWLAPFLGLLTRRGEPA